ncbi:MAG: hypothetical protein QY325_02435 [Flavobacteriales bacterium]|nr:MAG: hypothetical protein QY325_02435 [Flavobacteriales bacterium]
MPSDVVRIRSVVNADTPVDRRHGLQLVMHADLRRNKLSVLSVMGSARIGYRQGARIAWQLPKGEVVIRLDRLDNARCNPGLLPA